jgi:hypothetical protein
MYRIASRAVFHYWYDHYKKRTQRHEYLLRGLVYSLDANSPCLVTSQPNKRVSYYRSKTRVNGSQVYYNYQEIDAQASELLQSLAIQPEGRLHLQTTLQEWLEEMGKGDEGSELSRACQRLEFLATKRKNINRMAAEQVIGWDEFKELRAEVESEEAELTSRIDFITRHQVLFSADFELALDIACNLGWLFEKGDFAERRLLVETLFKRINVSQGKIMSYDLNPPFGIFCDPGTPSEANGKVRYESLLAGHSGQFPNYHSSKNS